MSLDHAPHVETVETNRGHGGIGHSVARPDGDLKVRGRFAFSGDLWAEGMLWGATVRSPHPHARIIGIDGEAAATMPGVHAVLTADDVPGPNAFGLILADQPVLADRIVRFEGEPVAVVAADTPERARRAAAAVRVDYELLPVVDSIAAARDPRTSPLHEGGNVVREMAIRRGVPGEAPVVVRGEYAIGMQDQAPLGTESGLALPTSGGGVELFANTQWIHADRNQLAAVLGMPPAKIRIQLAGVGGAFGAREDLSLQAHLCLLALATGKPVKMVYSREESFYGHVHRHPGTLVYEHGADRDGRLLYVRCRIELDGGAYASTSPAVVSNTASFAVGPYACPVVDIEAAVYYTNNPPCGAMRGFGAVQAAVGHEAQMDRLAREVGISPLDIRLLNVLDEGDAMPTGQIMPGPVPARRLLEELRDLPAADGTGMDSDSLMARPGGAGNVTRGESVRRGVGFGIGFKAGGMPEGIRDYSTARIRLSRAAGQVVAEVYTAAAEVGQGLVTVVAQITRTELGLETVVVHPADTAVGSAGSSSASRQTYMTGGAVQAACRAVRTELMERAHEHWGHHHPHLLEFDHVVQLRDEALRDDQGRFLGAMADLLDEPVDVERRYEHRPTTALDEDGQGDPHVQFIFAAHRAVADVDGDTGLTKLVELSVVQDVGRAMNPQAVEGQMEGGTAQGVGLALMEQMQTREGKLLNPSFTDYLIPTTLDVPAMQVKILEIPDPEAPYGVKGAGEPPTISSTPAVVAALRDATGVDLCRVPVRPWDLIGELAAPSASREEPQNVEERTES